MIPQFEAGGKNLAGQKNNGEALTGLPIRMLIEF
jgi:hypothetical protein